MKITEVELKHTSDVTEPVKKKESEHKELSWRDWLLFPRWDIAHIVLDEKENKEKILGKIKDNLICEGTWSGKHHITYWKHYNTADEYAEDYKE